MLESPTKIEVLSVSSFSSVSTFVLHFDAMLLVAYLFKTGLDPLPS